jgi:hypothetical protein
MRRQRDRHNLPATPFAVVRTKLRFGYLRAAQAYMLISMPTAISTISGFFQAMRSSRFAGLMPQWSEVRSGS